MPPTQVQVSPPEDSDGDDGAQFATKARLVIAIFENILCNYSVWSKFEVM